MAFRPRPITLQTFTSSYDNLITKLTDLRKLFLRHNEVSSNDSEWFMQIELDLEHLKCLLEYFDTSIRAKLSALPPSSRRNHYIELHNFHRNNLAHHRTRVRMIEELNEIDPCDIDYISFRGVYLSVEIMAEESLEYYQQLGGINWDRNENWDMDEIWDDSD
ncbi:hypothetical protein QR98_0098370 [Sarcoptes scabiei]|uniref:Uncharacterized protein n=1 Tax=Sarcoptes scabiei TaxID=52283 RepID=A0A132AK10_SARSC|nr:hypothetical protein QR98_0098370 [Sarcoptes scabiei]